MKHTNITCAILFILIASLNFLQAQNPAEGYLQLAEDFKKNTQPDSALVYYEKASVEFQISGNAEKLAHAYNQMGIILTRQDKCEPAKKYLEISCHNYFKYCVPKMNESSPN